MDRPDLVPRLQAASLELAAEPVITHIPAMTGATGRAAVERFYADRFSRTCPPT